MERIKSFTVNHDTLTEGVYTSRRDRNTVTYDLRMKVPNAGDYLTPAISHTLEHLCATYLRNAPHADEIVYFGPMGCMTGFYLVVFDTLSEEDMLCELRDAFAFIAAYEGPEIPGAKQRECGNFRCHDLPGARETAKKYLAVLNEWTPARLSYPE